jgi:CRP/FNR family cyclic AMP-dependent transcriptional regulator
MSSQAAPTHIGWMGPVANGAAPRPRPAERRFEPISLLDVDPELAAGLAAGDERLARRHLIVPSVRIDADPWSPPDDFRTALGLLVISGVLSCTSRAFAVPDIQLFGPADVFDSRLLVGGATTWRALVPAHVAILDGRFLLAARRWPQLMSGLARRLFEGQQEQHRLATIRALPRVEQRLMALLSHLASRWGCVTPDGLVIALPATHQLLGELVGARRPTVSLALTVLKEQGFVSRQPDGRWLLPRDSAEWATTGVPSDRRFARA